MGKKFRKHRKMVEHVNQITAIPRYLDKSERFVLHKCASYMERLFIFYPLADKETVKFIAWVLGPDTALLYERFIKELSDREKEKYSLIEEICLDAPEDIPENMHMILARTNRKKVEAFVNDCLSSIQARKTSLRYKGQSDIEKRIQTLSKMFSLTENEISLVEFIYIISVWEQAEYYFVDFLNCHNISGRRHLKTIMQMTDGEIREALSGTLARINFYEIERGTFKFKDDFMEFFQKPSNEFPSKDYFKKFSRETIPLDNHMVDSSVTDHVLNLLKVRPESSTHILLYGTPGTGKTSYALGLAKKLGGVTAYEICQDDFNHARNRRNSILACLNMTNGGDGSLVVVDEADNLLNTMGSWLSRGETQDKGWLNQLMEEPGVRMIWITNSIESIDPSVMRRFAFSIRFPDLNRRQRISLWNSILRRHNVKKYFNDNEIKKLAVRYPLSAAIIDMAVRKAIESLADKSKNLPSVVEMNLNAHTILLNNGEKLKSNGKIEDNYSIDGLNIEGNLPAIIEQLEVFDKYLRTANSTDGNFNLLFYGKPGTGKSELARYLARHLNRELIVKRSSDILCKYLGETEQNISNAFSEAETAEAVLVIDEADSFLFNRNDAIRSWEISQTNEFLTQMERFRGILICTTNRFKGLDEASIRRFNYKIGFHYLKPEGNVIFYRRLLSPLIQVTLGNKDEEILRNINNLTPGDFRIVRDRFAIVDPKNITHKMMIGALNEEALIKKMQEGIKPIGFK